MTDKRKPISASNPPESKGIRETVGYQPTTKPVKEELNPPTGGTNVSKNTADLSAEKRKKTKTEKTSLN